MPQQAGDSHYSEYLQKLPRVSGSDLGLDILDLGSGQGWETSVVEILLHQGILLVPLVTEPNVEFFLIIKRNVRNPKSPPV
jgi:hypothetical protein